MVLGFLFPRDPWKWRETTHTSNSPATLSSIVISNVTISIPIVLHVGPIMTVCILAVLTLCEKYLGHRSVVEYYSTISKCTWPGSLQYVPASMDCSRVIDNLQTRKSECTFWAFLFQRIAIALPKLRYSLLQTKRAKLSMLETFSCCAWHKHQIF